MPYATANRLPEHRHMTARRSLTAPKRWHSELDNHVPNAR
jgi:hypothetical protein